MAVHRIELPDFGFDAQAARDLFAEHPAMNGEPVRLIIPAMALYGSTFVHGIAESLEARGVTQVTIYGASVTDADRFDRALARRHVTARVFRDSQV
ncbi:hypothetical protein [Frigoribacterium sp. SL97]|uniref:hypothetical protein n=1 Tax=Frigoribacterium sp. SL97 TaxID=2994664 RepID=UPI002271A566|nr:hypothetical protein [Frigoribacterium sp. SL97]WAC50459.1 hypothetical protein OVA02_11315 [Frigoribacterium sp. SL97]